MTNYGWQVWYNSQFDQIYKVYWSYIGKKYWHLAYADAEVIRFKQSGKHWHYIGEL